MKHADWIGLNLDTKKDIIETCMVMSQHIDWMDTFVEMITNNIDVFDAFVDCAIETKRSGVSRWGSQGIIEVIRWSSTVREKGEGPKINNDHCADLARLAMIVIPELDGFFQVRERKSSRLTKCTVATEKGIDTCLSKAWP